MNHLQTETSPYLLQHAQNPVDWYPWGEEAFFRAKAEDKPVFLSIGYSTCHWCHVMARESFEDREIAALLNQSFIAVKVDREERPDVDSVYMAACQAFTGSGGWPATLFLTPEGQPFFAGTYFPKTSRDGMLDLQELLQMVAEQWAADRPSLLRRAKELIAHLERQVSPAGSPSDALPEKAVALYRRIYDPLNGGFGDAPKFPAAHNLLFLLTWYERKGDKACLEMAEHTLTQMYRGGLFDQIGFGFCRYSTDRRFLVPHFEKMLYDNAILILAFCKAYQLVSKPLYLRAARQTGGYILREMTSPEGGFYSAQDADSDGEEGAYYLFSPEELTGLLGQEAGDAFNRRFDIRPGGNFAGKSIPNLLSGDPEDRSLDALLEPVRQYRRQRRSLPLDDKILSGWNGLMIAALCRLYQASKEPVWLEAARRADRFLWENLWDERGLSVSFRAGRRGTGGFLEDYAALLFAQLALYDATLEQARLSRAETLCQEVFSRFGDEAGGFFLYGKDSQPLFLRPKECYDGASPSGNGLMAYNLVRLAQLLPEGGYSQKARRQLDFLAARAAAYPIGHATFLLAQLDHDDPPPQVTVVLADGADRAGLPLEIPAGAIVRLLDGPTAAYPLQNGKTTFYVCRGRSCRPPVNDLAEALAPDRL